jgi:hypothetical protein
MSNLKIYNTLARDKQTFKPMEAGKVRMYVCGMTIYDYCHIGHARMMMAFDVIYRWLKASGYQVQYVRNITDIEDKIIKRAVENGETIRSLTTRFAQYMDEDIGALGILQPTDVPRATEYVPQMLSLIEQLEAKGLAYKSDDGDVNYAVRNFEGYGKLSRQARWTTCAPASAWISIPASATRSTSCCGKPPRNPNRTKRSGTRNGAPAVRAGTSSARPCPARCWASSSTSTAAAATCNSRTTRTKSPSRKARSAIR